MRIALADALSRVFDYFIGCFRKIGKRSDNLPYFKGKTAGGG